MARSTKAAVLDETVEETTVEQTPKQIINEGISTFLEGAGLDVQHARYKVMRAIAFQAFSDRIEEGTFDQLVEDAIANADSLPSGWELERSAKEEAAKPAKATARKAPAKAAPKATARKAAPAKTAAKAAPRKRPAR
ncbi:hypothetical protein SEA_WILLIAMSTRONG_39 [Microbacterium phage WilliamStrong]|nr:hypothetical protein SEA_WILLIAMSTRONG_39 [Microbacterium phage WilliamStrong]